MWETSLCGLIRVGVWRSLAWGHPGQGLLARGIWERFHGQCQLGKAGQVEKVGDRAQCEHQMIIVQLVGVVVAVVETV